MKLAAKICAAIVLAHALLGGASRTVGLLYAARQGVLTTPFAVQMALSSVFVLLESVAALLVLTRFEFLAAQTKGTAWRPILKVGIVIAAIGSVWSIVTMPMAVVAMANLGLFSEGLAQNSALVLAPLAVSFFKSVCMIAMAVIVLTFRRKIDTGLAAEFA